MFSRKVVVSLSEETLKVMSDFKADLDVLVGLVGDIQTAHADLIEAIKEEAVITVDATNEEGITVFDEAQAAVEAEKDERKHPRSSKQPKKRRVEPPSAMVTPTPRLDTVDPNRQRSSPLTRTPRSVQVAWLLEILADGEWHAPATIAHDYAEDEKTARYLKSAVTNRFGELVKEGLIEKRDSQIRGSMFEYRLIRK